jgi:hypothetical protein
MMMDGVIDMIKLVGSMVYQDGFMPDSDEDGNIIQSREQASAYIKRFKKRIENGEILRYSMHNQISGLDCYKGFDASINKRRREEMDRLNEEYYGKDKYIKIKQCM